MADSLGLENRIKADIVLSKLDATGGRKILYSLQGRYYLIIIEEKSCFKEYVINVDDLCNVLEIKEIDNDKKIHELKAKRVLSKNEKKRLKDMLNNRQIVKEAFDTSQYNTGFITSIPDVTWVAGVPSYFVMKDENDKRYGEFSLSSLTIPCPINPKLWSFLIREVLENIY